MTLFRLWRCIQRLGHFSILGIALTLSAPVFAGDFEDAMAALARGDRENGFIILQRAANNGHAEAQYELGAFHHRNGPKRENIVAAIKWYRSAAEQGHTKAQYTLGRLLTFMKGSLENPPEGVKFLQSAADKGHSGARYALARALYKGLGAPQNTKKALKLYKSLAQQSHPAAMSMMGFFSAKGVGAPKNLKTANKWWRQAADKGSATAQYNLGVSYERGRGIKKNAEAAEIQFAKAAKQGHKKAAAQLATLQRKGKGATNKKNAKAKPPINTAQYLPKPGPIVMYEGFRLIGSTYPKAKNETFFKTMKFALKLVKELPLKFQQDIKLLKDIIYDPPSPLRKKVGVAENIVGVYTVINRNSAPAPVIIYKNLKWSSPLQVAQSLLGNSQHAKRHIEQINLRKRLAAMKKSGKSATPEFRKLRERHHVLQTGLDKSDLKIVDKLECEILLIHFEAIKAWKLDQGRQSRLSRTLSTRKCW